MTDQSDVEKIIAHPTGDVKFQIRDDAARGFYDEIIQDIRGINELDAGESVDLDEVLEKARSIIECAEVDLDKPLSLDEE